MPRAARFQRDRSGTRRTGLAGLLVVLLLLAGRPTRSQDIDVGEAASDNSPPLITLEDAIALALRRAPSILVADEGIDRAEARALEALMARMPTFSGRFAAAPAGPVRGNAIESTSGTDLAAIGDIFDQFTVQVQSRLDITVPLYTFGKIRLATQLADVGLEAAELQLLKAELELIFNVTRAYLGLQLSQALDELIADGTRRLDDARSALEDRLFEGDPSARTQLRELTIEGASFTGQVSDNRLLSVIARQGLEYYCGLEGHFRIEPLDDSVGDRQLASLETIQELARRYRPDLALLDRAVEASDLSAAFEWRQLVPDLFLGLGLRFNRHPLADDQQSPFANDPYNSAGFGFVVGLNWNFDFRRIARAQIAEQDADRARLQRDEAVGGIEIEITQAYYEALGHEDRALAYDEALRAARAWLRQRTLQFDSGLADYDDLSDPLLAYFAMFAAYHQALFDLRLARANLAVKVGLEELEGGRGLVSEPADEGDPRPDDGEDGAAEPPSE